MLLYEYLFIFLLERTVGAYQVSKFKYVRLEKYYLRITRITHQLTEMIMFHQNSRLYSLFLIVLHIIFLLLHWLCISVFYLNKFIFSFSCQDDMFSRTKKKTTKKTTSRYTMSQFSKNSTHTTAAISRQNSDSIRVLQMALLLLLLDQVKMNQFWLCSKTSSIL